MTQTSFDVISLVLRDMGVLRGRIPAPDVKTNAPYDAQRPHDVKYQRPSDIGRRQPTRERHREDRPERPSGVGKRP